jgi:DtxR family transcriptional regulator, Mn-dependent transcriptional regulator
MSGYNPLIALIVFVLLFVLAYLVFRPVRGWFWIVKNNLRTNEKIIIEDILKQLYHFENSRKDVDINILTRALDFDDNLIVNTVNKMAISELLHFEKDFLVLSNSGRDYALRIVRVHRLWEKYLAEKTGYDKAEWHDRAEKMEHELSHEETDILANQLGNPMYDPHGDPIPTSKGKVAKLSGVSLPSLAENCMGKITHIEDEPEVIYKQILAANIHIGSHIRIVESNKHRVVFYAEGEEFKLAPIVAANITVDILEKENIIEENLVRLSSLQKKETAEIIGISKECRGENRRRLLDLGFVKNSEISIDLMSPLKNPRAYMIKGTSIALRNDQASKILIKKV